MSILYLVTAPPPAIAGTDAVLREVAALRDAFQGEIINLSPLTSSTQRFPKQLYGLHKVRELRSTERRCRINHVFFPFPYPFPVLRLLRNPIFYTATASLDPGRRPFALGSLKRLERIIVSNERDAGILKAWGLSNHAIIPSGIDAQGLQPAALPLDRELTLLMASAPWDRRQFESKGIDLLLATAARLPFVRLILLWRGMLADELSKRVARLGIGERVEIVNRRVRVSDYLARAHATIVLAHNGGVVRSFPHSLIESLLAGKPVLLSDTIAMSEYVTGLDCGVVVREMSVAALSAAIDLLMRRYEELASSTRRITPDAFSIEAMIEDHRRLYGL
jgi:glycosyltransferase involved in cell wall biosynthesis